MLNEVCQVLFPGQSVLRHNVTPAHPEWPFLGAFPKVSLRRKCGFKGGADGFYLLCRLSFWGGVFSLPRDSDPKLQMVQKLQATWGSREMGPPPKQGREVRQQVAKEGTLLGTNHGTADPVRWVLCDRE